MAVSADRIAEEMWSIARREEQCARRIASDDVAAAVRREVRRLAASDGIKVRTARMDDAVVVVRLDAAVWREDVATMRRKLSPEP